MVAGFFFALAPLPARADDDKDTRAEIAGLRAQVESLRAAVSALESQVSTLQAGNTTLQNEINSLQTSNTALQSQLVAVQSNHALLLGPFVSVDPNPEIGVIGPNIIFTGANIHIVSGSGRTDDNGNPRGLGNLIIGYDEDPIHYFAGSPGAPSSLLPGDRGGSHNLVIGAANRFTRAACGGLVAGQANRIENFGASVLGGQVNTASGFLATVGSGQLNIASGHCASVTGGLHNTASGPFSSVTGGVNNVAGGWDTVVIGGPGVVDNNAGSIAPQPPFP
jgi:hypothetical protein